MSIWTPQSQKSKHNVLHHPKANNRKETWYRKTMQYIGTLLQVAWATICKQGFSTHLQPVHSHAKKIHKICNGISMLRLWSLACLQLYTFIVWIFLFVMLEIYMIPPCQNVKPDKCTQTIPSEENCAAESSEPRDSWVVPPVQLLGSVFKCCVTKLMGTSSTLTCRKLHSKLTLWLRSN